MSELFILAVLVKIFKRLLNQDFLDSSKKVLKIFVNIFVKIFVKIFVSLLNRGPD